MKLRRDEIRVHVARELVKIRKIILAGCGTAWHAGPIGEYLFEDLARIPTEVEYASEFRYRKGKVIAVATEGDEAIAKYSDHVIYVPDCVAPLQPLLTVVPLQLLAYHAPVARGCNVDKPRNLAKSVTVE